MTERNIFVIELYLMSSRNMYPYNAYIYTYILYYYNVEKQCCKYKYEIFINKSRRNILK